MKHFSWVLLLFIITGAELWSQTTSPVKTGVMVVRKKQMVEFEKEKRVTSNNLTLNNNSEIKPTTKRNPGYKGEPYVGRAEEVMDTVIDKNKNDFHYKYLDNALLLYGDFNAKPYMLFEIKSSISQKLYLYFGEKWFELKQNPKKTPLIEINNPSLVRYLNTLINK